MKSIVCMIGTILVCTASYAGDDAATGGSGAEVDPVLPGSGTIIELEQLDTPVQPEPVKHIEPEAATPVTEQTVSQQLAPPATAAVKPAPSINAAVKPPATPVYTVQLGAFKARERAFALYWELSKKVTPLQVTAPMPKDELYRVRYGSYPNYEEAKAAAEKLRKKGVECFVTTLKTLEIIPMKSESK